MEEIRKATAPSLEAPSTPDQLMHATPTKRGDLSEVARMLRASQPGQDEDDAEDEIPPEELVTMERPPEEQTSFGAPEWFHLPAQGLPADVEPGTVLVFMRFPPWLTGNPRKPERQCALRPLTPKLERFARQRATGDKTGYETTVELAKMMICVVDGQWPELFRAGPGSVNHFWTEIGPKARQIIVNEYVRTHQLTKKEREDFLSDCIATRTVA
jgi:hypothetical protein